MSGHFQPDNCIKISMSFTGECRGSSFPLAGTNAETAIEFVVDQLNGNAGHCRIIDRHELTFFRDSFAKMDESAFYGNSMTYITQACRGLGFGVMYRKGDTILPLGFQNSHFVVVRPLGLLDSVFVEMLDRLVAISQRPVFLKKVSAQQHEEIRGFRDFKITTSYDAVKREAKPGVYPWDVEAYADDDTYPELILDLDITLSYEILLRDWEIIYRKAQSLPPCKERMNSVRRNFKQYRRCMRQFNRAGVAVLIEQFKSDRTDDVMKFITGYFGNDKQNNINAYENMLELLSIYGPGDGFYGYVVYLQNEPIPIGFYAAEKLDKDSAGLYSGLCKRTVAGLPEYARTEVYRQLRQHGIKYLNLGGAEETKLDTYKHHFAPIRERQIPMLVYGLDQCRGPSSEFKKEMLGIQ